MYTAKDNYINTYTMISQAENDGININTIYTQIRVVAGTDIQKKKWLSFLIMIENVPSACHTFYITTSSAEKTLQLLHMKQNSWPGKEDVVRVCRAYSLHGQSIWWQRHRTGNEKAEPMNLVGETCVLTVNFFGFFLRSLCSWGRLHP